MFIKIYIFKPIFKHEPAYLIFVLVLLLGGAFYTQWGRSNCTKPDSELVYSGIIVMFRLWFNVALTYQFRSYHESEIKEMYNSKKGKEAGNGKRQDDIDHLKKNYTRDPRTLIRSHEWNCKNNML